MHPHWLKKLSRDLSLEPYDQDWGICNSDSSRLGEFLEYYRINQVQHPWEPEALAELIFQSAEDAVHAGELSKTLQSELIEFISNNSEQFPLTAAYWADLEQDEWFVPRLLVGRMDA